MSEAAITWVSNTQLLSAVLFVLSAAASVIGHVCIVRERRAADPDIATISTLEQMAFGSGFMGLVALTAMVRPEIWRDPVTQLNLAAVWIWVGWAGAILINVYGQLRAGRGTHPLQRGTRHRGHA